METAPTPRETPPPETGRVIPFVPRKPAAAPKAEAPVEDIGKYARSPDEDYRQRMRNNVLALLVLVGLVLAGMWMALRIAEHRKAQDCVLSGRPGCTPVTVPARES
jgi:hypothetical protein